MLFVLTLKRAFWAIQITNTYEWNFNKKSQFIAQHYFMALPINEINLFDSFRASWFLSTFTDHHQSLWIENQRTASETGEMIAIDYGVCNILKWATPSIEKNNTFFIDSFIIIWFYEYFFSHLIFSWYRKFHLESVYRSELNKSTTNFISFVPDWCVNQHNRYPILAGVIA